MDTAVVYMTARDREEALRIGRTLVEERLVACVNVLAGVTSVYWWEDAVQEDRELVLIAKTKESLVGAVARRVKELHSYECPCVVSWSIDAGSDAYLDWIVRETR
ncbi:MAG: divalent-cation tolerance protein CutA [Planctomycetes bacterium]|nr:divalent-cation tolerance protein CutA [Planctomycetota bacterium]